MARPLPTWEPDQILHSGSQEPPRRGRGRRLGEERVIRSLRWAAIWSMVCNRDLVILVHGCIPRIQHLKTSFINLSCPRMIQDDGPVYDCITMEIIYIIHHLRWFDGPIKQLCLVRPGRLGRSPHLWWKIGMSMKWALLYMPIVWGHVCIYVYIYIYIWLLYIV